MKDVENETHPRAWNLEDVETETHPSLRILVYGKIETQWDYDFWWRLRPIVIETDQKMLRLRLFQETRYSMVPSQQFQMQFSPLAKHYNAPPILGGHNSSIFTKNYYIREKIEFEIFGRVHFWFVILYTPIFLIRNFISCNVCST